MKRTTFIRSALAIALVAVCSGAHAQARSGVTRFVVPYPAGGPADQIARLVAQHASAALGKPILIENKAGAAGMIAAESVLRADADGATFYLGSNAPMVINQAIYRKMPYDPEKDFVPVAGIAKANLLLVTRNDLGAKDLSSLIAMGKNNPGKLTMGSASSGNITHLAGEHAVSKMGFKVTHVPFSGTAPAMNSLMAGDVDMLFDGVALSLAHIKSGRIIPLVYLANHRSTSLPDVPTANELGFKGVEASAWFGLMARADTPKAAIETINAAINEALKKPELAERLKSMEFQSMPGTQQQFAQFIDEERKLWIPLAKSLGVRAD